jgi:hypothetical protein
VAEGHMATGSGMLFKFPEFLGSTSYMANCRAHVSVFEGNVLQNAKLSWLQSSTFVFLLTCFSTSFWASITFTEDKTKIIQGICSSIKEQL